MADRYNPQVIEHLVRPRNAGELETPSGVGESGDAACGDVARFSVAIEENYLHEVRYKVYGCAACIAAGSALSELVRGRPLLEAARVSRADLEGALGGPLPTGKEHALTLVLDALHKAFEDHWNRQAGKMLVEGVLGGRDGSAGSAGSARKSVVAAMSGGVDSAVTALLLKEAGYDVATVTFRLHDGERGSRSCCSPDTVLFARDTAHRMGLPHFTLNLKELFDKRVMRDFVGSYVAGETPNPCVSCNAHVKFHAAAFLADRLGMKHVATGHYARVVEDRAGVTMARPVDARKDQTYVLWPVPKELLSRTIFPLGEYRKEEVRRIAEERGSRSPTPRRARTSALSRTATTGASSAKRYRRSPVRSWTREGAPSGGTRASWTLRWGSAAASVSPPRRRSTSPRYARPKSRSSSGVKRIWRRARSASGTSTGCSTLWRPTRCRSATTDTPWRARSRARAAGSGSRDSPSRSSASRRANRRSFTVVTGSSVAGWCAGVPGRGNASRSRVYVWMVGV